MVLPVKKTLCIWKALINKFNLMKFLAYLKGICLYVEQNMSFVVYYYELVQMSKKNLFFCSWFMCWPTAVMFLRHLMYISIPLHFQLSCNFSTFIWQRFHLAGMVQRILQNSTKRFFWDTLSATLFLFVRIHSRMAYMMNI